MTASQLARALGATAAAFLAVSCAGETGEGRGTSGAVATAAPTVEAGATIATSVSPSPEPTGVPGLNDPDRFCAAWVTYAATVQVLSIAGSFGSLDAVELAEMELIAAPALRSAMAAMSTAFPAELEFERNVFMDELVGPIARRAERASQFLVAAGLGAAQAETLEGVWLRALQSRDPSEPVPDVDVPAELAAALTTAGSAFAAEVTAFTMDPSLDRSGVATPSTDAHIAATCPDLADLGVGDSL